ncbi:unnamed protein product [Gongylonema pulchrum]|uniref:Uncharacterized protein n=1 Tax=Gongylonema pulchrum TaxID=637853 RepID=A0A3P7M7E7_9BILA|nr:unnamed protein product [Gongylonema pulchrum]
MLKENCFLSSDFQPEVQSSLFVDDSDVGASSSTSDDDDESDEDQSRSDVDENESSEKEENVESMSQDATDIGKRDEDQKEELSRRKLESRKVEEAETLRSKRECLADDSILSNNEQITSFGGRQITFKLKPQGTTAVKERYAERQRQHLEERKQLRRGAREITRTLKRLPGRKPFGRRGAGR